MPSARLALDYLREREKQIDRGVDLIAVDGDTLRVHSERQILVNMVEDLAQVRAADIDRL